VAREEKELTREAAEAPQRERRALRIRVMKRVPVGIALSLAMFLGSCAPTEESVAKVENGPFEILIRSQEFHHSSIHNVDICVASSGGRGFPRHKSQCFLHGFDFSGLSARWLPERDIQISFTAGRVTHFTNSAFVYPNGTVPVEFHTSLCDGCATASR
jgi:hypothetical protein